MLWQELISLEVTSTSLVPTLKALLKSREDREAIYKLTGLEAQNVVDSINQAIDSPQLAEPLRKNALHVLCKLCGSCQLLPTRCVLGDELVETGIQIGSGGFADVWQGVYGEMHVAIKRLRFSERDDLTKMYKRFCKEVVIWKRLSHPNVLPLLGISTNGNALCMISKLMSYGNIMAYLRAQPSANRLLLLAYVGEGLSYLHDLDLVHGDMKGANILVDDECMPRIADFGLISIMKDTDTILDTHTSVGGIGTPRWSAPELLDPPVFGFKSCRPSKKSDCYSLGMTIYEVLTGRVPFYDVKTDAVMMRIVRGIRPERPHLSHAIGFTDPVWAIVEDCWKEHCPLRPDVPTVVQCLTTAAARWIPTPLLDGPRVTDESEPFSLITFYGSSENTHASNSVTPRGENLERDDDEEASMTVAPPHYSNSVAENFHELAERFYCYFQRSRKIEDLDWAIKHEQEAVFTYLHTHPGRLHSLARLAGHYCERHEISQDPRDIRLSIEKGSDVERRTTTGDPIRPDALLILAKAHHAYYGRDPQQEDLEAVIRYSSEAATLYPSGHPVRAETLVVLSVALHDRYQASLGRGDSQPPYNDLDDAISNSATVIDILSLSDPRLPYSHTRLSAFLFARYQRTRSLNDLRQSVHHARLASADLTPEKRPESLIYLGHLLTHLSPNSQTLTELAKCSREALDLLPPGDYRGIGAIHNLVTASHRMYVTLNSAGHLDEAIDYNRQLLRLLSYGSRPRHLQLQLHHNLLEYRLNERQIDVDFAEMVDTAREIAEAESQSYHDHYYSAQPSMPPSSTPETPSNGPSIAPPFEYRPPQHWSPRPYYYDDSAISLTGSTYTSTDSVETGDYGSGSDSSLVGHTINLSFIEPDPDH
ncbi:kinase-like protein [Thelephora ganbajun]|uniref:Kinase-like protein n=1 Tax=Thelephora ganbajun TaxID=370292 RepID=A0ACB6ZSA4_THEGA|nr:kinase-like protein [Thelephora ganbajun]